MYKLKCPFCQRVTTFPFVRVGSVGTCAGCGKRFRIREQHVTRNVRIVPVPPGEVDPLLPNEPPKPRNQSAEDLAETTGLSGLSRLMEETGQQPTAKRPGKVARQDPKKSESISASQVQTPRESIEQVRARVRRRRQRSLYLIATGSGAVAALLIGAIWFAVQPTTHRQPHRLADAANAVIASANTLAAKSWTPLNQPQPFAVPATQNQITITSSELVRKSGKLYYTALVTNHGEKVIRNATIHLALLNQVGWLIAKANLPVALLAQGLPEPIRVQLPPQANLRGSRVKAYAQNITPMPHSVALAKPVESYALGRGPDTAIVIHFVNPFEKPLAGVLFLVTASNRQHQPVGRWLVKWNQSIDAGKQIVLKALTPVDANIDAQQWQVRAVGQNQPPAK